MDFKDHEQVLTRTGSPPTLPEYGLHPLIAAEQTDRPVRTLRSPLKAARFPLHRDLARFDFAESPLSESRLRQLATASFTATVHHLIFRGGTGTGKSHWAIARGIAAIQAGKRVRFDNVVDLVNPWEREKPLGRAGSLARRLT